MKKLALNIVMMVCAGLIRSDDVVSNACSSVSSVVAALSVGRRGSSSYIREFGVPLKNDPAYLELVGNVSNNQDAVCANFSVCTSAGCRARWTWRLPVS